MSAQPIALSVIACTRNRAAQLVGMLKSLAECSQPRHWGYELIVVDNGSTDSTKAVVEQARSASPCAVRYVTEMRKGLSHARDTGWLNARGELVAFVDDDVRVDAQWLHRVRGAFSGPGQVEGLVGRVLPFESAPQELLVGMKFEADRQTFRFPCRISIGHGCNMAFPRNVIAKIGVFDPRLDPGAPLHAAGGTDCIYRLCKQGGTVVYEPSVLVFHQPRADSAEAWRSHYRNAKGFAGFLMIHGIWGDGYALKNLYWFAQDTWKRYWWARRAGEEVVRKTKAMYLRGLAAGMAHGAVLGLTPPRGAATGSVARFLPEAGR